MRWSIPEKVIERGRTYLKEGRVLSVIPDAARRVWHGEVLGSELYLVDLDGSGKENDICECPYWEEHGYCKHTVAVELYLRDKGLSRIVQASQELPEKKVESSVSFADILNQGFSRLEQAKEPVQPLLVEFVVEPLPTNPYHPELDVLAVSLRIGNRNSKRTYIVKNLYDFLHAYQIDAAYTVNKEYRFQIEAGAFEPACRDIIEDLVGISETYQLLGKTGLQVKGKLDKRYLLLPVHRLQRLLKRMEETGNLTVKLGEKKYHYLYEGQELPLTFELSKNEDHFELMIEDAFTTYFSNYFLGFSQNALYAMSHEQQDSYMTLKQLMKRLKEPVIVYQQQQLPRLFTDVFPYLRKIGRVVIAEEVAEIVQEETLKSVVIFRKIKGMIRAEVEFHYGQVYFTTNEAHQPALPQKIEILRDRKQEKQLLDLFTKYRYQSIETGYEKTIPSKEGLFYFFKQEIADFRKLAEVKMGKKLRQLFLDGEEFQPMIEVDQTGSWLDIRFDVSGIGDSEIDQVLDSLLRKDRFYTLDTGEVLSFDSQAFQQTSELISQLRDRINPEKGVVRVPKSQGLLIEQRLENNSHARFSDNFKAMVNDLTHPESYPVEVPTALNATLRPYQETGFRWLKMLKAYGFGGILADEMGLGKTLQVITFLLSEKSQQRIKAVIVAPASLIYNWQAEIKKFAPTLESVVSSGSRDERESLIAKGAEIIITSYASLRQDIDLHEQQDYQYLILDEAQMVKNAATKTSSALRQLHIPYRFALSGTPIENNLEELWALFQTVMPGFFPSIGRFRQLQVKEIAKMIQPFVLRRDKDTVLDDLPERIESNVLSSLTEEQKTVYLAYLRRMKQEVDQMDSATFRKQRVSILAGLTRLRQICDDPRLFIEDYQGGSGKLEQVKDLIQAAKENGRRVLLFSQFTSMLSILEQELADLGITSFYLRGSTKVKDRLTMVDQFNAGEKDIFLISLKAGGTGLNLTGADTVILYDLWWNPAVEEQAAGRAHRIGQKKVVEVWRMIAEGTIEERMNQLQQEKRELFQKVIQGNEEQANKLTEEDIRMILTLGE
ncbi:Snf2 family helicase [Enterococcus florum]|uniref:Snf2 family helicase n=1 Tax=Enterococcus florum TaxID=2480627 RepID=A0A4P5P7S2_9ENTE|nr:DEAD/DEAH box helicase [Enterococcus florum]GCF94035.1 Snf2 family helicase [Enterococcus florum]